MSSQAWNRITQTVRMLPSQCPLLGACHRLAKALSAAMQRQHGPGAGNTTFTALPNPTNTLSPADTVPQGAFGAKNKENKERHMALTTLTDSNFAQIVEKNSGVVLVDFWAPWCMPCRMVGPAIERLAGEFEGRVTVGKLNVDDNMDVASRYRISGIPTVAIFRNGKLVNQMVGVRPEQAYRKALESALESATATAATASAGTTKTKANPAKHSVTVFSTPTCPWCSRLKSYLREQQVAFKDVDVSRDAIAAQEMMRRSGQMGVPQAWIDGQVVVGFDRKRVDALLGLPAGAA